ncbi:MAG: hypothetical protein A2798_00475 [Candidatus Levybacteria bacterium RIFCSPHIGHO2_01_FULL_37_17]|nr:MAG: hypothetical protein A2798_00475 [Candidatus Levybacteria bacterium RIFCSPHIGHO2_01_FULL_37_17]OGH36438.1 MAG: hypothetical protein A2959_02890 [Candidatus Levybacteria bacterium RIFCSPLOWO2_01_FULL_38_23]
MARKIILIFIVVLVGIFLFLSFLNREIKVSQVAPKDGSQNNSLYPNIAATFSRKISSNEQEKMQVTISPNIKYISYWSSDQQTLYLLPEQSFVPSTKYLVEVSLNNYSYSWGFTTSSNPVPTEDDLTQRQAQEDIITAVEQGEFDKKYPWYDQIPEPSNDYFIGFDSDKEKFFVAIYPKYSSPNSISQQEEELKKQVLTVLQNIGVDTNKYSVEYKSFPR